MSGPLDIVNLEEAGRRLGLRNFRWYRRMAEQGKYEPFPASIGRVGRTDVYDMNQVQAWYEHNVRPAQNRRGARKETA